MPHSSISRRRLLHRGCALAALLATNTRPMSLRAADAATSEFRFIVANDLHYFDEKCAPFFHRVAAQIKKASDPIDFILLAGDLSDWGQNFQFAAIRDIFKTTGLPFHVVCGNHDWTNWDDRSAFLDIFPKSLNYTFEHKGFQFIALDSTDHNLMRRVNVPRETLQWLDDMLRKIDPRRPVITFSHFPLSPQLTYPAANAADILRRFENHNLQAIFGGHYHGHRRHQARDALIQTNPCLSFRVRNHDRTPSKGYLLCHAKDGRITEQKFVECV